MSEGIKGEAGKIGAGAGVGAIIGAILGGAKGALAGILIGGAGTIAATEGTDENGRTLEPSPLRNVRAAYLAGALGAASGALGAAAAGAAAGDDAFARLIPLS